MIFELHKDLTFASYRDPDTISLRSLGLIGVAKNLADYVSIS